LKSESGLAHERVKWL